jgi:HK97 family phage prohead protease
VEVSFAHAEFRADTGKRMVSGLIVEWNTVAPSGGRRWRFRPGSLHWSAVNRIKLNRHHENTDLIGVALDISESPRGLHGSFRVARTTEGDQALAMAADGILDGFSIEVDFTEDDEYGPDPTDASVTLVKRGTLRGVAITGTPAFDEARVESVAASRDQRLELRLDDDEASAVRMAAEDAGVSMSELVRGTLRHYTKQRPVYSLDASGVTPSLVCDTWHAANEGSLGPAMDARDRLAAHERFMRTVRATFAAQTTSTASQIIPPGYKPLLASIEADRPLYAAASKGDLSDATPFVIPANITEASVDTGAAVVAENVQPTEGTLTFTGSTISPVGVKGIFKCTREIVDSSNPAIDAVAFQVMREDFNRETEKQIFAELNLQQSGTITAGQVPSGAQARTSAGAALPADLRKAVLNYVDFRKSKARSVVAASRASVSDALESLDLQAFALRDVSIELSPWITGVAAGDGDVFVLGTGDLWAWSSALLDFQFAERAGPANVDLAIFAYFATKMIKPVGLSSIRHT